MSTKLYLRSTPPTTPPFPGERSITLPGGGYTFIQTGDENQSMSPTKGGEQATITQLRNLVVGPYQYYFARFTSNVLLTAQTIPPTTWTIAYGYKIDAPPNKVTSFAVAMLGSIYAWRPSNNIVPGFIIDGAQMDSFGGTLPKDNFFGKNYGGAGSFAGSSVVVNDFDVLVFEWWMQLTIAGQAGFNWNENFTLNYNGKTEPSTTVT